ncbi:MAG: hypothetical protein II299_03390 [Alistipes sp.]|nr:hypothetical protein [Alistipes sp.]
MKQNFFCGIIASIATLLLASCSQSSIDTSQIDSFAEAKPVWAKDRERESNLTLSFREIIKTRWTNNAYIRLTASCDYRLRINGEFVAHGPSVAAHDFYRIDCYDIKPHLKWGKNIIAIEVAGYNDDNYYLLNQPSFLQAEVEVNGEVVAATGDKFTAYDLRQRKQDVREFSFQRPHIEHYTLTPDFDAWATRKNWQAPEAVTLVEQPAKTLLPRHVPYPDYTLHEAEKIGDGLYKFKCNSTGFLGIKIKVEEPSAIRLAFDEILSNDGHVNGNRFGCYAYITYELRPGEYSLEAFEPNTMQYVEVLTDKGSCTVEQIYMRDYCGSDVKRAKFECNDEAMNRLFEAARETHRQNALDIFMDCPSRERAGWLCDSYFASRVAFDMSGHTRIEHNFLNNFLLPTEFKHIDKGMLPMCYPSDHPNQNHIPNWAMWFVLELEEYLHRSGDQVLIDRAKQRVYELVDYFKPFLNDDGLLEGLTRWVFVEWSAANSFVQDVNYPSNMLYAKMLEVVGRLYNDPTLTEQAAQVRKVIVEQSFDGEFFIDNAVRGKGGRLELTRNRTETCQYYAFYLGTATPESHPELWSKMLDKFGAVRTTNNEYPEIHPSNAFIGNYLRMELLSQAGRAKQILDENRSFYLPMVDKTGTLWENMTDHASCNHGFAAHIARVLYRDVLGVYKIAPNEKRITLRFNDCGLTHCKGSIPLGDESVDVEWSLENDTLTATVYIPEGYTVDYSLNGIKTCNFTAY